jgi:amino acid transporter, AAT family
MASSPPKSKGTLVKALRIRHLIFLAVGGTIASGFYLASGAAISLAGPAVLITYVVAGLVTIGVMACLAELSVQGYSAAGFAKYAKDMFGPLIGFLTGWNYWLAWVPGLSAEAIAVGTYLHAFTIFQAYPIWVIAGVVLILDTAVNLIGVLTMGNYELTLSAIKIAVLTIFALVGVAAILGIGMSPVGVANYSNQGGLFPLGVGGLFTSFLLVFYAYTGIELVSVSSEESVHPEKDVPRALIGSAAIVMAIFVAVIAVLLALSSWKTLGTSSSPLIDALNGIHQPVIANLMTLGIVIASISAIDAGIYVSSRLLFAFARDGYFPKVFARLNPRRGVPVVATITCSASMFALVVLDILSPTYAFVFLGSLATLGFMWAWTIIPVMTIVWRTRLGAEKVRALKWKMPWYPFIPIACILLVGVAIIAPIFQNTPGLFGISGGALPVVAGAVWVAIWTVYYMTIAKRLRAKHLLEHPDAEDMPAIVTSTT